MADFFLGELGSDQAEPANPSRSKKLIAETYKRRRKEAANDCREAWDRATKNSDFAAGEGQWPDDDSAKLKKRKAARIVYNEIGPVLDTLAGRQILNRFQRVYIPRNRAAGPWAEMIGLVDTAMMDACDAAQEESMAFRSGPGVAGISAIEWTLDELEDEDGRIAVSHVPLWNVLWPAKEARKINLVDRPWHSVGQWQPREVVRRRYPKAKLLESSQPAHQEARSERSSVIPWMGMAGERAMASYDPRNKCYWIERYEWREVEPYRVVAIPNEGMSYGDLIAAQAQDPVAAEQLVTLQKMAEDEFEAFRKGWRDGRGEKVPDRYALEKDRYAYHFAKIAGDEVLETARSPVGLFTLEFLTGIPWEKVDEVVWMSMVDRLHDAQLWKNVFLSMLVRFLQVNPKGVLFVERGVFKNRNEGLRQFRMPGGVVELERGAMARGGGKPFHFEAGGPIPIAAMVGEMMRYADEAIPRLSGFNQAALGQVPDPRRVSGHVIRALQEAAMASNAGMFDSYSLYRRRAGRLFVRFMHAFFDAEDIERIVGEERAYVEEPGPDGQSVYVPQIPPKEAWLDTQWKITVEDAQPDPDRIAEAWGSMTSSGALEVLLQPQPATGQPILTAADIVEIIPAMPEWLRAKMRSRVQAELDALARQQATAATEEPPPEEPPPPPPPEEALAA